MKNYYEEMHTILDDCFTAQKAGDTAKATELLAKYYSVKEEATAALGYDAETGMLPFERMSVEHSMGLNPLGV